MRILLIDNGTTFLEKLKILIPGEEIILRPESISPNLSLEFDLIILSGSRDHTAKYDGSYFKNEIELIQNSNIPLIGICLGCELIAIAFDGTLKRMDERHSGIRNIHLMSSVYLDSKEIEVFESHRWIIDDLPKDFRILATSSDGPEMIRHNSRPIWGLQFHPENFVDMTKGDEIFNKILSEISTFQKSGI